MLLLRDVFPQVLSRLRRLGKDCILLQHLLVLLELVLEQQSRLGQVRSYVHILIRTALLHSCLRRQLLDQFRISVSFLEPSWSYLRYLVRFPFLYVLLVEVLTRRPHQETVLY